MGSQRVALRGWGNLVDDGLGVDGGGAVGPRIAVAMEFLSDLSEWIADFGGTPWAMLLLAILAFTEAIFSPLPLDPLLISMGVARPDLAFLHAAIGTGFSVAGGLVGYWIGQRWGRPVVLKFTSPGRIERAERMFQKYGVWAVLVAAITPIPYKVFTISAGLLELNLRAFLIVSLVGRGIRFFVGAGLIILFGPAVEELLGVWFPLATGGALAAAVLVLVGGLIIARVKRMVRGGRSDGEDIEDEAGAGQS